MTGMDSYKISAEEFAKTSFSRLATRPNSSTVNGEGRMSAEELKKRFDKQGELFREKFNAFISLVSHVGEGDSLASLMLTGISQDHTLKALFEDIVSASGRFASYLSVGDQTLLEKLISIEKALATADGVMSEHCEAQNPHGVTAEQVGLGKVDNTSDVDKPVSTAQQEAIDACVKRVKTSQQSVYTTDTNQASSGKTVPIYESVSSNSIPRRGAGGRLKVGAPVDSQDAVNKEFLEAIVALLVAKQGNQTINGDLSISGDLYVTGSAYGTDVESLNVKDAVIVANADGVPLAELSGYVIRASESQAYGILYDPVEDCVKIGLGTFDTENKVFAYDEGEAQILATRSAVQNGNVPVWNGEKNTFEDSGKKASELATEQYIDELYGNIDVALDGILAEQESIIAIQNALIGGGV